MIFSALSVAPANLHVPFHILDLDFLRMRLAGRLPSIRSGYPGSTTENFRRNGPLAARQSDVQRKQAA
jgi:hypothetical protein